MRLRLSNAASPMLYGLARRSPRRVVAQVCQGDIPLATAEGGAFARFKAPCGLEPQSPHQVVGFRALGRTVSAGRGACRACADVSASPVAINESC
jgi:hypothetical protein